MAKQVLPSNRQPILFSRTTDYTHMAALRTQGLDGRIYHVLYVGTGITNLFIVNFAFYKCLYILLNNCMQYI